MKAIMMPFPVFQITGLLTNSFRLFIDLNANVVQADYTRKIAEINIPGKEGNVLQDLGSMPTRYQVSGKWIATTQPDGYGIDTSHSRLGNLRGRFGWNWLRVMDMQLYFRLGFPILFGCDFAPMTVVLIERMSFRQVGGQPHVYDYQFSLVEYSELAKWIGNVVGASSVALASFVLSGDINNPTNLGDTFGI